MASLFAYLAAVVLVLHGGAHLLGTAVYLQLAEVPDLAYKTTIFGGQWNLGATGIHVFGLLWTVAAIGFVASAVGLLAHWRRWQELLLAVTILSLVLTVLDWTVAYTGIVVNLAILTGLLIRSRR